MTDTASVLREMLAEAEVACLRLDVEIEIAEANLTMTDVPDDVASVWRRDLDRLRLARRAAGTRVNVLRHRLDGQSYGGSST